MALGERIRHLREAKGMRPLDIATVAGVGLGEYQRYESGELEPNPAILQKIAAALGTVVAHLRTNERGWLIAERPRDEAGGYTPGVAVVAPDLAGAQRLAEELWPTLPGDFKPIKPPREVF